MIGATSDASGLFATIDGVRVKVGDIDTSKLNFNLGDGTITINDLDVTRRRRAEAAAERRARPD